MQGMLEYEWLLTCSNGRKLPLQNKRSYFTLKGGWLSRWDIQIENRLEYLQLYSKQVPAEIFQTSHQVVASRYNGHTQLVGDPKVDQELIEDII